ncbi:MAG: Flp family type IVb pilin [Actinomycetota bacterium]
MTTQPTPAPTPTPAERSEQGATLVEYVLLVALIAIAVIGAVVFFRNGVVDVFERTGNGLSQGMN